MLVEMAQSLKVEMSTNVCKVLLIDDDIIFSKIIMVALRDLGMNVETLSVAPSKRKVARLKSYDLILLDYDLEGTTGFALAEVFNKAVPDLPVILISSSSRPYQDKLSSLPNIIGFVSKWSGTEEFYLKSTELYRDRLDQLAKGGISVDQGTLGV